MQGSEDHPWGHLRHRRTDPVPHVAQDQHLPGKAIGDPTGADFHQRQVLWIIWRPDLDESAIVDPRIGAHQDARLAGGSEHDQFVADALDAINGPTFYGFAPG